MYYLSSDQVIYFILLIFNSFELYISVENDEVGLQ